MNPIIFNVKDKSANTFFAEHALEQNCEDMMGARKGPDVSAYHLLRDEIFLKKSAGIEVNQTVIFQLEDRSVMSKKPLVNTYTYQAEQYDNVGIKLVLKDFKISINDNSKQPS